MILIYLCTLAHCDCAALFSSTNIWSVCSRGGGGGFKSGGFKSSVPARTPPPSPPATYAPQAKQPGLFGQMAATAGGVAVGSAVVSVTVFYIILYVLL